MDGRQSLSRQGWPPDSGPGDGAEEDPYGDSATYGGSERGGSRRSGGGSVVATFVGIVLLGLGAFVAVWALAGPSGPPAEAQQIPTTVGTAVPKVREPAHAAALGASVPVRIVIPAISVDAPVTKLGLNPNGSVEVPPLDDHNLAGWYTGSVTPGQTGASVILGHVDSWSGGSVFFKIKTLRAGDVVNVIRADGSTAIFTVDGLQKAPKVAFPTDAVYNNPGYPALRLITCGGPFNASTGEYLDNIIVYAHLTGSTGGRPPGRQSGSKPA